MRVEEGQLKLFLVDSGLVKEDAIKRVEAKAKQTGKKFEEVLLNEGLVSQEDLIRLKAYILGLSLIHI